MLHLTKAPRASYLLANCLFAAGVNATIIAPAVVDAAKKDALREQEKTEKQTPTPSKRA